MAPPTARTESDKAAQVVMSASGAAIMATVAAGTMTPPRPKQAMVPRAMVVTTFSGVITDRAPPKHVSIPAATKRIHLQSPGNVLRRAFQKMAPIAVAKPAEMPRRPISTGTGSQTVEMVRGQKLSKLRSKKLASCLYVA